MKKRKDEYFVYSVFSTELQDYPYYPFIAKNHVNAINIFLHFINNRDTVCESPELHCIGECKVNPSNEIIEGSIQPYIIPFRVNVKHNIINDTIILGHFYMDILKKYLEKLFKLRKEEKCKLNKKTK